MNGKHPVAAPLYGRGNAHAALSLCMDGEAPMPCRHYVWTGKRPVAAALCMDGETPMPHQHYVWTGNAHAAPPAPL